jgi:hypothetical protein
VFVGKGGIDLATTSDDDDLHRHLVNSGYADAAALNRITSRETTLAAIAESNQAMVELIREMTVESLYHIADRGNEFQVREGATTPYASPKTFELEALLHDTDERKKEWTKVTDVVPDLGGAINFRRDLGEREEVTVKVDDWKVLSEIGTGSSVQEIADHLGTTEFWTARVAARLVSNDLVVLRSSEHPTDSGDEGDVAPLVPESRDVPVPADDHEVYETGQSEQMPTQPTEERELPAETEPVFATPIQDEEEVDPNESWWQEPKDEGKSVDEDAEVDQRTPEVVSEGLSEIPTVEGSRDAVVEEAEGDDDSDVEDDTEAFLEKVFSELDSSDSSDESDSEAEEGHGLLRRRRMGSLRDFSSDS